jgi:predicted phosphoribosyltransferase
MKAAVIKKRKYDHSDMVYADRKILQDSEYAAHLLARKVMRYKCSNAIVVGVGPNGSSVGPPLAKELNLPFHVVLCREIKHPADATKIIGFVSDSSVVMNLNTNSHDIPLDFLARQVTNLKSKIEKEYKAIYSDQPKPSFRNKVVIPVVDILTTPENLLAGIETLKTHTPLQVIVAVPVVAIQAAAKVAGEVTHLVFLHIESNAIDRKFDDQNSPIELLKIKGAIDSLKRFGT